MRLLGRLWLVVALSVGSIFAYGHGSFQCLAELERRAHGFARCSGSVFVCDQPYEAMVDQLSLCRSEGFDDRVVDQAMRRGYAQVSKREVTSALNASYVSGRQLSAANNWHRFRQTFGGFFDHDRTLLSVGFDSERCGQDIEGSKDSVHWVGRLKFSGKGQQDQQWDVFERVQPQQCYARTPEVLLVANIPNQFLRFYRKVWLRAFPNQRVIECSSRDQCQAQMEEKNRQFRHYRALLSALDRWRGCNVKPGQSHCMGEDWRGRIVELEREQNRAWQLITQLYL